MLKHRNEQIQFTIRLLDVAISAGAFLAAYWIRVKTAMLPVAPGEIGPIDSLSWMLAASIAIHLILYPACGFYGSLRLKTVTDLIAMVLKSFAAEFFVLGSLVFLLQAKTTSRYFFGIYLAVNYGLVLLERVSARVLLSSIRKRGYNYRQVLIAGTGSNARRVAQTLRQHKHWGYIPCGFLREPGEPSGASDVEGIPILGGLEDLEKIALTRTVDEVYFALNHLDAELMEKQAGICEKLGVPARFSLGFLQLSNSQVTFSQLGALPVMTYYTTLMTPFQALAKRIMDIVISLIGLCITAALFPWISRRIKRESPGPVIFKQVRVGENGRRFKCYKFRTMYLDAESRKEVLQAENQMEGPIFKIEHDPRITPFGAFLRQSSMDELPQFFNILRGDMSVVGTRPPTPDEVMRYQTHYRRRLSIRPGLTGLWQVSGRNSIKRFEDILALDLKYIDEWSIWLDVKIIFRTIWITVFRHGAY